ncbi:MAG: four helix bundle protein [Algibacter sp.]
MDNPTLNKEKFIGYSIRSLAEVITCLFKAKRRHYISESEFTELYNEGHHLMNMMSALKKNIK